MALSSASGPPDEGAGPVAAEGAALPQALTALCRLDRPAVLLPVPGRQPVGAPKSSVDQTCPSASFTTANPATRKLRCWMLARWPALAR